jgi:curved DNA-binding protein CbpA
MLKKSGLLRSCKIPHPYHLPESAATRCATGPRPYATVSDPEHRPPWPSQTTSPTPYQILGQKKDSPYSKRRFYELVKLYHPDRHDRGSDEIGLSHATKLERYLLIVAANDLLSDPVKRRAYDRYGAGWSGQPGDSGLRDACYSETGWRGPNGPSRNATWEDWEKWYQRDAKRPQEPIYVSNGAFACLIAAFAAVGGIAHAARVGKHSRSYMEHQDALHDDTFEELRRRRKDTTATFSNKEERIHEFLRQRDQYRLPDPRDEKKRKLLPPP